MPYTEIRIVNSEIIIKGENLEKLKQEKICKANGKAGVYVWGFYDNEKFYPLYVGKHGNLHERLIQHYCGLRGGEYQMFDFNSICSNYPSSKRIKVYEPKCFDNNMINYQRNLQINLSNILDNFAFRYIEVSDTANGEKYLTEAVLNKLCSSLYPKIDLKKVLLSGSRGGGCPMIHYKSSDLDEMILDIP